MCVPCEAAKARKEAALELRLKTEGMALAALYPLPPPDPLIGELVARLLSRDKN